MESGLEDRNNLSKLGEGIAKWPIVSMESGLEDRNNGDDAVNGYRIDPESQWSPA